MILTLTIAGVLLYLLGAAFTFIFTAVNILLDGSGVPPETWGPFSKWLSITIKRGDLLGNAVILLNTLFWPLTLPLFLLKW
jgi:hypothetical protein